MQTAFDEHLVLGKPITTERTSKDAIMIENAIKTKILINNSSLERNPSSMFSTEDEIQDKIESNKNDFKLPDFSKFSILDLKNYSSNIQNWIGYVLALNAKSFKAKLEDLTDGGTHEIGDFDIEENVSPEDLTLVKKGAIFYLSVGSMYRHGQKENTSILRFQRLVLWTESNFDSYLDRAKFWESNPNAD
jgi:hypothetical protein